MNKPIYLLCTSQLLLHFYLREGYLFFNICLSLELEKIYIDKICNIPLVSNLNLDAFPGESDMV